MKRLQLLDKADLNIYYDADMTQYDHDPISRPNITRERFMEFFANARSRGFSLDGKEFGGVLFHDGQIHFAVSPEYQGRWAFLLEPVLKWVFSLQPVTDVAVSRSNQKAIGMWDKAGVLRLSEDERSVTFRFCDHPNLFFNKRIKRSMIAAEIL